MTGAKFLKAVNMIRTLSKESPFQPPEDEKLKFYGLYKQATIGDVNTPRPGTLDFAGKAKWDAWNECNGMSSDNAKAKYVEILAASLTQISDDELLKQLEAA